MKADELDNPINSPVNCDGSLYVSMLLFLCIFSITFTLLVSHKLCMLSASEPAFSLPLT